MRRGILDGRLLHLFGAGLVVLFSLAPPPAHAQAVSGTILGSVKDSTGAVVPGATVTVLNTGTGFTRTVITEARGEYTAPLIPTGTYTVSAEIAGFRARAEIRTLNNRFADLKLLAMDMDSTLITIECIDEIADMRGIKPQVAAITASAMRGEIDFAESLRRRVALLAGLDVGALARVYDERLRISPGAEAMPAPARPLRLMKSRRFRFSFIRGQIV